MAGKIKIAIVALVAVLILELTTSAATNSTASGNTNRFEGPAGHFTIDLPADWKPISPKVLLAWLDPYARDHAAESGRVIQYKWSNTIETTLTSVQIPEWLRYKARPGLTSASRSAASLELVFIVGLPLVSLIGWFILNRKCGEIMTDEI